MFKCTHENCEHGPGGKKSFKLKRYLNYHLKNVHGKRENACKVCRKKFALKWQLKQHQKDCGQSFKCFSCGLSYDRWLTLLMHCHRKNHCLPENRPSSRRSKSSNDPLPASEAPSSAGTSSNNHSITFQNSLIPITRPVFYIIPVIQNLSPEAPPQRSIATDTHDLYTHQVTSGYKGSIALPKTANTQTQTTVISEYESNEFLIRDQFLPASFSQSVQTERTNSLQNSETQTSMGTGISLQTQTQSARNQATQFDAFNYWDLDFIDNQTQTVWNLDRHTQTDIERLYDL